MTKNPTLVGLAAQVMQLAESLNRHLEESNVPAPHFGADSPTSYSNLSTEAFLTRQMLIDTLMDMWYLTQGPSESVFNYVHNCIPDAAALNTLNHFDFWSAVPLEGSATHAEIAERVSLPLEAVSRLLQHATTLRIFEEEEQTTTGPDGAARVVAAVRHTSRSAALARTAGLRALVSTVLDDAGPPVLLLHEALRRFGRGRDELPSAPGESAFALFHSGGAWGRYDDTWDFIEQDGEGERQGWRSRNFAVFMQYIKDIFRLEQVVLESCDWAKVGRATVVDVGGSGGHDALVLARNFPELTITVQDMPKVQAVFEKNLAAEPALASRVSFQPHDFYQPQPVQADIYLIKLILHDYSDAEAIRILRALVPALKPGARIIFIEYIGDHSATDTGGVPLPRSIRQMGTATDLRMMAIFNTKERPVEAWRDVFKAADERFEIASVEANPLRFFAVIEVVWSG